MEALTYPYPNEKEYNPETADEDTKTFIKGLMVACSNIYDTFDWGKNQYMTYKDEMGREEMVFMYRGPQFSAAIEALNLPSDTKRRAFCAEGALRLAVECDLQKQNIEIGGIEACANRDRAENLALNFLHHYLTELDAARGIENDNGVHLAEWNDFLPFIPFEDAGKNVVKSMFDNAIHYVDTGEISENPLGLS